MTLEPSPRRRVVVTGLGAVTPLGSSASETWESALAGRSGIDQIQLFDTEGCPVTIAGEVTDFDVTREIPPLYPRGKDQPAITQACSKKDKKKLGRFIELALSSGLEAYADSGLDSIRDRLDPTRLGVNIGVGMGGLPEIENIHTALTEKGYKRITPFFIPQVIPNLASGHLSILLNFQGANLCNVTACSSSAHSIGETFRKIQSGELDAALVGGAESVVSPLGIGGFAAMKALSTRNDAPQKASRPFDQNRDGFVMGEGGVTLVLEDFEHAQARGAQIYAEVLGYGLSGDAYHMTLPAPEGRGGYQAMEMALKDAGIRPNQLHYVNAHGTSTPSGDAEEARAIARLCPEGKDHLHVSSTKSMTGHLLGAAGAIEALFSILAIRDGKIPPTINLDHLDEACEQTGLCFTPHTAVEKPVHYALSNSFGFGGTNASLIFGKVES